MELHLNMDNLATIFYIFVYQYIDVYGETLSTVVPIHVKLNGTTKSALRYGFHKTNECLNYEISYLCIQKCLDLNYDVAHADKNCKCTCYIKKDKAKYSPKYNFTRTKWKLGAPTTSIPAWAQEKIKINVDVEDNQNEDSELSREIYIDDESKMSPDLYLPITDNVNTMETEPEPNVGENIDSPKPDKLEFDNINEFKVTESTDTSNVEENTDEAKVDGNTDEPNVGQNTEDKEQSLSNPTEENVDEKEGES